MVKVVNSLSHTPDWHIGKDILCSAVYKSEYQPFLNYQKPSFSGCTTTLWSLRRMIHFKEGQLWQNILASLLKGVYHIYPKYFDTSTPYRTCYKNLNKSIYYPILCLKVAGWVANSADPDEMPHYVASHLGLHCLLRHVFPFTYGGLSFG